MAGEDGDAGRRQDGVLANVRLPSSIEAMWGLRDRPARGPRPSLSVPAIVDAAIIVVERDGLGSLSMSRIAAELGSAPMSLYRYVASKDELLALMFDAGMGEPPPDPEPSRGWRAGLERWTAAVFERYRSRSWTVRIPLTGPPLTPNQIRWLEWALRSMQGTHLAEAEKLSVVLLLSGYARSQALMAVDFADAARAGIDPSAAAARYGQTLLRLIDPEQFPAVHAAIVSGSLDDDYQPGDDTHEDLFIAEELRFGLDRILDGIEVLVTARQAEITR